MKDKISAATKENNSVEDLEKRFDAEHKTWILAERADNGGGIIRPLGWDRYRRLYWRFPMDRRLFVQTTADSLPVPAEASPTASATKKKGVMMFDAEDSQDQGTTVPAAADSEGQASDATIGWGTLAWAHIPELIASLNPRGVRECALKKTVETLLKHVNKEYPSAESGGAGGEGEGPVRMTRSRILGGGYINRLR
eukprot:PhF_6_TR5613/c0_g1_i2/m.8118